MEDDGAAKKGRWLVDAGPAGRRGLRPIAPVHRHILVAEVASPDGGLAGTGTQAEVDQQLGLGKAVGGFGFVEGERRGGHRKSTFA